MSSITARAGSIIRYRGLPCSWRGVRCLSSNSSSITTTTTSTPYITGTQTHFGYKSVNVDEKESHVKQVFENVAESYDVMNDLMSLGIHRYWKDELIRRTAMSSISRAIRRQGESSSSSSKTTAASFSILDVAGGTGDVAFRFVEAGGHVERSKSSGVDPLSVTVCDINAAMLDVGERRARARFGHDILDHSRGLRFVQGNAECLPFQDGEFDLYTIAFGLRNVTDVDLGLRDAYRVLKPGGRFLCLEFSHLPNSLLQSLYDAYSINMIPLLGQYVANDRPSYQYLVESIRRFPKQTELVSRMKDAGFHNVTYTNLNEGIVAIHEGWKPLN